MRKIIKRLTAAMLSLTMVAACALQTGAAEVDYPVKKIVLKHVEGTKYADDESWPFDSADNDSVYKPKQYQVSYSGSSETSDITIQPVSPSENFGGRFSFTFGVYRQDGQIVSINSTDVNGSGLYESTVDDTGITYFKLPIGRIRTTDSSGELDITATVKSAPHKVTYRKDGVGFTVSGPDTVDDKSTLSFSVTVLSDSVEQGYVPNVYDGNNRLTNPSEKSTNPSVDESGNQTYTYSIGNVTSDKEIQISLVRKQCKVTLDPESKGKGSSYTTTAGDTSIDYGTDYSFVVTPTDGYSAGNIDVKVTENKDGGEKLGEGKFVRSGNNCLVKAVTEDIKITIEGPTSGAQRTITFYAPKGAGYSFKKDGLGSGQELETTKVDYGKDYDFQLVVNAEYNNSIENMVVTANGTTLVPQTVVSNPNARKYTISKITTDITVNVAGVTKNTYKVTTKDGAWGTFTATGSTTVEHGGNFTFKLNVQPAYQSKFSTDDGGTQYIKVTIGTDAAAATTKLQYESATKTYTVTGITDETTIEVQNVEPDKYSATDVTGAPTKTTYKITDLNSSGEKNIDYNGSCTFTVKPNVGYRIDTVTYTMGSGGAREATRLSSNAQDGSVTYVISDITSNVNITVTTAKVRFRITYVDPKTGHNTVTNIYWIDDSIDSSDIYVTGIDKEYGTITLKNLSNTDYYTFVQWTGNGEKKTTLSFTHEDQEITLTAQFKFEIGKLFQVNITKSVFENDKYSQDSRFRLWLIAAWKADPRMEDLEGKVRIENCGFLYSDQEITYDPERLKTLLYDRAGGKLKDQTMQKVKEKLYIYNYSNQSTDVNKEVFEMLEAQFSWNVGGTKPGSTRHIKAYVVVVVNGERYCLMSEEKTVTAAN